MIVVKLMGGLGNQMFQYAAAKRLALYRGTELKLDLSFFEGIQAGVTRRGYDLRHLNISAEIASRREIAELADRKWNLLQFIPTRFRQIVGLEKRDQNIYSERHFDFDPVILQLPDNTYLNGYWQSEKYFTEIRDILLREFAFKYEQNAKSREITCQIEKTESVSLHIRRGDYAHDPLTNKVHGLCSFDYYTNAVNYITQKKSNCHFYIFSDDHAWVCENFKIDYPFTMVDHNDTSTNYDDLRLMSLCRHNIIANSAFSWWGAWLNANPEKIVVAPEKWFNDKYLDTKDLIPEAWIKI